MIQFRLKRKKMVLAIAGVSVLVIAFVILWGTDPFVKVYKVKRGVFESTISCKGEIQSEKAVLINIPDIFGDRTLELYETQIKDMVAEGTIVKKGDYVALLDQGRIKQLIESNDALVKKLIFNINDSKIDSAVDLVAQRDAIEQFKFDLQYKKIELEQSVYESPAYQRIAQMSYDRALRQLDYKKRSYQLTQKSLRIQVSREEERLKRYIEKGEKLQLALQAARITAPQDGILIYGRTHGRGGLRKLTIGSSVSAQHPLIATLPDLSVLVSETYVEEIYISKIKVGDSARVYIDALKNLEMDGVIASISNVGQEMADYDSKVFKVNIRIKPDKKKIVPAMTTNNEIIISNEENVLVIPRSSLFSNEGQSFVYLKEGGKITIRKVETGNQNEKLVVIKSGLKEGDKILLTNPEMEES